VNIFAIGDLHLPGDSEKRMDVFGDAWREHAVRVAADWDSAVASDDLVLLPGDLSWATKLEGARADLEWLESRPGRKILVKGNHDHWWGSIGKVRAALPPRCHAIQNDAWFDPPTGVGVAGTRLWDVPGLALGDIIEMREFPDDLVRPKAPPDPEKTERLFRREIHRLEMSLAALPPAAGTRIAMLHYPPTNPALEPTRATELLERYRIDVCVFGHLHSVRDGVRFDGERNGVRYVLVSADFVDFRLVRILTGGEAESTLTKT
jgi:predicted phosphohydrolase